MNCTSQNGSTPAGRGALVAVIAVYEDVNLYDQVGIERYLREMARPDSLFADSFRFVPFVLEKRRLKDCLIPKRRLDVTISRETARGSVLEASN